MAPAAGHLDPRRRSHRPNERSGLALMVALLALFGVLVLLFT